LPPVASPLYGRLEPLQSLDQRIGVLRVPNGGDGVSGHEPELEPPEPHAIPYADFRWRPLPVARRPVRERDDPFVELDFEPDFDRSRDPVFALVREPGLRATLSRSEEPLGLGLARFLLVADALERLAEPVVRLADALARLADPLVLD